MFCSTPHLSLMRIEAQIKKLFSIYMIAILLDHTVEASGRVD